MKISRYIVSKSFFDIKNNIEKTILFSTKSAKILVLDRKIWDYLLNGNFHMVSKKVLTNLITHEFVINDNEDELNNILKDNEDYKNSNNQYYYVIMPSATCQLGCHYCGQSHSALKLNNEKEELILQRIKDKLLNKKYQRLKIGWFGGEPLTGISKIESISEKLLDFCNKNSIYYSSGMTTNGLLLKRNIALNLFKKYKISQFEITLDGIASFHDERRHTKNRNKTFDIIYKNLVDICKDKPEELEISVRCNTDNRNKDGILPLLEKIRSDGIQDKLFIYFAQIHSWGNNAHNLAAEKNEFASWELDWFTYMLNNEFNIRLIPGRTKNLCMAVNQHSELVDPFGDVFSCTETSLVQAYKNSDDKNIYRLGNIKEKIDETKRIIFSDFYDENEFNKYPCFSCNMLPVCGGGCPKSWKDGLQACPNEKFNMPERLMLYYANIKQRSLSNF